MDLGFCIDIGRECCYALSANLQASNMMCKLRMNSKTIRQKKCVHLFISDLVLQGLEFTLMLPPHLGLL